MISSTPIANALFLEWSGVIDETIDSGFDPLGHLWEMTFDQWEMDTTWQGDDWITDFHIEFDGLTSGTLVINGDFIVEKPLDDINWDCQSTDTGLECQAVDPINDRVNPGEVFIIGVKFEDEQSQTITFNAEWTMDVNGDDEVVGGSLLPIDSTSLLLAGAQTFSWMIPVVLSVLGIGLFVVSRKSKNS